MATSSLSRRPTTYLATLVRMASVSTSSCVVNVSISGSASRNFELGRWLSSCSAGGKDVLPPVGTWRKRAELGQGAHRARWLATSPLHLTEFREGDQAWGRSLADRILSADLSKPDELSVLLEGEVQTLQQLAAVLKGIQFHGRVHHSARSSTPAQACLAVHSWWERAAGGHSTLVPDGAAPGAVEVLELLTRARVKAGDWRGAREAHAQMQLLGAEPTPGAYKALMRGYVRGRQINLALEVYEKMKAGSVALDKETFDMLICGCAATGASPQPCLAEQVHEDRIRAGYPATSYTNSLLLKVFIQAGMTEKADALIARMAEADQALSVEAYNSKMRRLLELDNPEAAKQALGVFEHMQSKGARPDTNSFNLLARALARCGRAREATETYARMTAAGLKPNMTTLTTMVAICVEERNWERASELFHKMVVQNRLPIKPFSWDQLTTACEKGKHWEQVLLRFRGEPPETRICNKLIGACRRGGYWEACVQIVELMRWAGVPPDTRTLNLLTATVGKAGHVQYALDCYRDMLAAGVRPDTVTFNTLMNVCMQDSKNCQYRQALEVYEWMKAEGVKPDTETLNNVMKAWTKAGSWDEALAAFQQMHAFGLKPNTSSYNIMISACAKANQLGYMMTLFSEMKESNVPVTVTTFNSLLRACELAKDLELALQLVGEMGDAGLSPNSNTFKYLLGACAEQGQDCEPTLQLFQGLQKVGLKADTAVYTALVSACRESADWDQQWQLYQQMLEDGLRPDTSMLNALIASASSKGSVKQAADTLQELKAQGLTPNEWSYNAVLNACSKASDWQRAIEVFQDMRNTGIAPNTVTYTTLISALGRAGQWERAVKVYSQMKAECVPRNEYTYSALISACNRGQQLGTSLQMFESMKEEGVKVNTVVYNTLITACGNSLDWQRAIEIFDEMKAANVTPNVSTYNTLIAACGACGQLNTCEKLYSEMKAAGIEANTRTYVALSKGATVME